MMTAQEIAVIIDRLPPTVSTSVDYYLWIATWQPTDAVRAAYRATPAARALHRRTVAASLAKRDTATLTPLLLLNAIPVAEELFVEIATQQPPVVSLRPFMTAFWEHVATLPRPSRLLHDPTIREPFRDWATTVFIPWISTHYRPHDFAEIWTTTILPTWEAVRASPLPTIPSGVAAELAATAWAPERVVDWCLPYDDAAELRRRWTVTERRQAQM